MAQVVKQMQCPEFKPQHCGKKTASISKIQFKNNNGFEWVFSNTIYKCLTSA
jgi:hypothetical protein